MAWANSCPGAGMSSFRPWAIEDSAVDCWALGEPNPSLFKMVMVVVVKGFERVLKGLSVCFVDFFFFNQMFILVIWVSVLVICVHLLVLLWSSFIFLFIFIQWFKIKENILVFKSGFMFLLLLFKVLLDLNSCDFLF